MSAVQSLETLRLKLEISINIQNRRFFLSLLCLLLVACSLLASCGKKGEPTLKSYEKPSAPSELKAIHRESEITLLWNFPKGKGPSLKGFHLMKSTGGAFDKIAFIESDHRSYTDKDFQTEHTYKYKVISESLKGITSNDSNILEIKPKSPPTPPGNISFSIEHDSVTFTWKSAGEGIFYNIYKGDTTGTYPLMPLNRAPLADTYFKDAFTINKSVYYSIRSLAGGEFRDEGPASEEIRIDPSAFVPPAPKGVQAAVTEENVYLIWREPPETWITGYRIYRETGKEDGYVLIGESQTPSFLDKDSPLTKRNYRVTAVGPSKEGPPAEITGVVFIKQR